MLRETLPEEPREREAIILMSEVDIACSFEGELIQGSKNITVLEYPFVNDSIKESKLYKSLEKANLIEQNAVLSQSPYDPDVYYPAAPEEPEKLILSNALDKYNLFSKFCKELGATRVHSKEIKSEQSIASKEFGGKVGGTTPSGMPAGANFQADLESKLAEELELESEDIYEGNPNPNIEAAKKFLERYRLFNDKTFTDLLEAREGSYNQIKGRKRSFSLTSESVNSLKILAGIELSFFNASGNYKKEVRNLKNIKVSLNVEFEKG